MSSTNEADPNCIGRHLEKPPTDLENKATSSPPVMFEDDRDLRNNRVDNQTFWDNMPLLNPSWDFPSTALGLVSQSFHKDNNERYHYTDKYDIDNLVVRRDRGWLFTLNFDRDVDASTDDIVLQFAYGRQPMESKGTVLRMNLNLSAGVATHSLVGGWKVWVKRIEGRVVETVVTAPANAFVGKYAVFVETMKKDDAGSLRRYDMKDKDVIILFNPWSKDDDVFMEKEEERNEYVLNDNGLIWINSPDSSGTPWYFGQFDKPVLEAALYLMEQSATPVTARGSPVTFSRALSSLANSKDNAGVLEGRWKNTFPGNHTKPWVWSGSVKILKEFMKTDKPVKYGQCWVFSGLITSLMRSLGIPTRSVTNFESAHDTDGSMTVDSHFDVDGKPMPKINNDSVWNFHCWNESFFKRPDLPNGYDGWQVVDSTPLEESDGISRCGPAPVKAVKEGHVYLKYDVGFVFAEVNGDKINWKVTKNGEMTVMNIDRSAIGKNISTKAVGSNWRVDLTSNYKYPEGSADERRVVRSVQTYGKKSDLDIYDKNAEKDVTFSVMIRPESPEIGQDFEIAVNVKNTSKEMRSVSGNLIIASSYYTGVTGKEIVASPFQTRLGAGEETYFSLWITADNYVNKLTPEATIEIRPCFKVQETKQEYCSPKSFTLKKPALKFWVPDGVRVGEISRCYAGFVNPLSVPLTGAVIDLEGGVIVSNDKHIFDQPIQPGERASFAFDIKPKNAGVREVTGTFSSDQFSGSVGSVEIKIPPASN